MSRVLPAWAWRCEECACSEAPSNGLHSANVLAIWALLHTSKYDMKRRTYEILNFFCCRLLIHKATRHNALGEMSNGLQPLLKLDRGVTHVRNGAGKPVLCFCVVTSGSRFQLRIKLGMSLDRTRHLYAAPNASRPRLVPAGLVSESTASQP